MANLCVFRNDWSKIYDFNPSNGNFKVSTRPPAGIKKYNEDSSCEKSTVPVTIPRTELVNGAQYHLFVIFDSQVNAHIWLQESNLKPLLTNYHLFSQHQPESVYPFDILESCRNRSEGISLLFTDRPYCPLDHASIVYTLDLDALQPF